MNKYQKALDNVKAIEVESEECFYVCDLYEDDIKTLQELVDKETPKKPIRFIYKFYVSPYKCPVCKTIPHTCTQKYCDECGQKLDWSGEDEN